MLRRDLTRGLALLLVATLARPWIVAGRSVAVKRGKTKLVTRTFSTTEPVVIPGAGVADPFPAMLPAGGLKRAKIVDVQATLHGVSYTNPDDLRVELMAPNGKTVPLMYGAGGATSITGLTLTFDDEAPAALPDGGPLLEDDTYRPTVYGVPPGPTTPYRALSTFAGSHPHGTWQLYVGSGPAAGEGSIAGGWSVEVTAKVKQKR